MVAIEFSLLQEWVERCGFELYAVVRPPQIAPVLRRSAEKLQAWQERGYAGEMGFMERSPELFSSFHGILPETRTVVIVVAPYQRRHESVHARPASAGRIARYAWGRDYHRVLKKRLQAVVELAQQATGKEIRARVFSDSVPILERSIVASTGLGFIGKNTLFIRPGDGSFSFIGEILWDAEIVDPPGRTGPLTLVDTTVPGSGCKSCSRCLSACPTNAFPEPGVLDSRRCIAYLTIEKREPFTEWEAGAIGEWLFGCDVCQEVCPFNHSNVGDTSIPDLRAEAGVGPYLALAPILEIDSSEKFSRRFAGTSLMRAGRARLIRNACAVAANTASVSLLPQLLNLLADDPDEAVRSQAAASLRRLQDLTTGIDRLKVERALAARSGGVV